MAGSVSSDVGQGTCGEGQDGSRAPSDELMPGPGCPIAGPAELAEAGPLASAPLVSVIVPCHNAARWLDECLASVRAQTHRPLELSLWDDSSSDGSASIVEAARSLFQEAGVSLAFGGGSSSSGPLGCGAAKNRAVRQSSGEYLCFLDADDTVRCDRVAAQLHVLLSLGPDHLVGSRVRREPEDAQPRYTAWLNGVSDAQLKLQRLCECTVAMPTWFCARSLFDGLDGFCEAGPGTPEDLEFFYRHLRAGGSLAKVPEPLVMYRYHEQQQSRGVSAEAIWALRIAELELSFLPRLQSFSIWSAGRDGKRLYRSLSQENRRKVVAFLDVDPGKLAAGLYYDREQKVHVPIVSFTCAAQAEYQPTIICVKQGMYAAFEENLASLQLTEGQHYWHFQ
mmetsp:Transcript_82309/g.236507  ORF Transcript_82309/g.236507 Transcript_82309/m.236507 type:complete len:394 (-) Transcript_82309:87-1268(-)